MHLSCSFRYIRTQRCSYRSCGSLSGADSGKTTQTSLPHHSVSFLRNLFSGKTIYDVWTMAMFNTLFTSLQPMYVGLFERDIGEQLAMKVWDSVII